jgi:hypothetical protein
MRPKLFFKAKQEKKGKKKKQTKEKKQNDLSGPLQTKNRSPLNPIRHSNDAINK